MLNCHTLQKNSSRSRSGSQHLLLHHPPKMKIQWIQIRGVNWPDDRHALTDHSVLELFNKKIFCQSVTHHSQKSTHNEQNGVSKYNFPRWFGNMSHFKKDNLKETPCTYNEFWHANIRVHIRWLTTVGFKSPMY